jgi:hypothetical protein
MKIEDRGLRTAQRGSLAHGEPAIDDPPSSILSDKLPGVSGGSWLMLLCLTLLGYALLGKGWAYVGVPPVFIGELVLFCGLASFVVFGRWRGLLGVPASWFLLLLVGWGLLRTWPDFGRYGVEALRDGVIWGYSAFALIVGESILAQPSRLVILVRRYRQFSLIFLVCVPFLWTISQFLTAAIPRWPWADVPVLFANGGEVLVHLSGLLAFGVAGLGSGLGLLRLVLLAGCVLLVGTFDRAGLLAFLAVFAVCFCCKPHDRSLWRLITLGVLGLVVLALTDVRVQMPGREREISFGQMAANLASVGGATRTGDLDATKQWRLEWWSDIVAYTVQGRYFWTGKGFGINLADEDGYQVEEDGSLRSPHNGHLTMLARGGVPGFGLWALVQLSWACGLLGGYVRSHRRGDRHWPGVFLFLLAYWLAFMINATFNVFLEGPMGGIWFWTIYGVGLAALWLYRHQPEVLDRP